MYFIYNDISLQHKTGDHPECAERLADFTQLMQTELVDASPFLSLVHSKKHILAVQNAAEQRLPLDPDTLTSEKSYEAAVAGVSAAILASETNGFSLMRPPGHHSYANKASGFCLFNSMAVAAQKQVDAGKKVLIFDFDGHFGDGTSDIFYESDNVLYWSIHQAPAFPYKGKTYEIGEGKGKGFNWNIPLSHSCGDDIFLKAVNCFLPLVEQFKPDVVGISAGFDGHHSDPLLEMNLSFHSFYEVGILLQEKFKNVFAVLEGGYNLEYLPRCIECFIAGMKNEKMPHDEPRTFSNRETMTDYEETIRTLMNELSVYWEVGNCVK